MANKVPEGWRRVALGDVAERSTQTFDPTTGDARRYVALENITPGRRTIESFGCSSDTKSTKTIFEASDVLFGKLRPYLRKVVLPEQSGVCSTDIFAIRPTKSVISEFLYAVMADERTIQFAVNHSRGTKMPRTSWKELAKLPILLPPLPEQKKIAAILSSVDEAIEATEAVIEQTRTVKQGLLQELLTRGIGHSEFKKTPIGEIPKSWEVISLENAGLWHSGGTPTRSNELFWDGHIPWISPKDMKTSKLESSIEKITSAAVNEGRARLYPPGTILIVVRGMILAHSAPVGVLTVEAAFNQDIKGVIPNDKLIPEFLTYWLEFQKTNILKLVAESTHGTKRIPTSSLQQLPVIVPPLDEQRRIVARVNSVDETSDTNQKLKTSLKNLKKGLLQDLLTGKVRVKSAEGAESEDGEELAEAMAE